MSRRKYKFEIVYPGKDRALKHHEEFGFFNSENEALLHHFALKKTYNVQGYGYLSRWGTAADMRIRPNDVFGEN